MENPPETALLEAFIGNRWIDLPTPAPNNYEPTYTHYENSTLDANAYLQRDIIRYNRPKIYCGWDILSMEQMELLQSLYDYDYFYLRYTDKKGKRVTAKVYAGPVEGKGAKMNFKTYLIRLWTKNQMNFIGY